MYLTRAIRQHAAPFRRSFIAFSTSVKHNTGSDYGSGVHNSKENPKVDQEHPGPPPPSAAQGSDKKESTSLSLGSSSSSGGAQPKILNESALKENEQSAEVKEHNKDLGSRADQAHERAGDEEQQKVDKEFWKGHGGVDKDS